MQTFKTRQMRVVCSLAAIALLASLGACATGAPEAMTAQALQGWATIGNDPGGQRFSPLTQITPDNVGQLREAWVYHMKPADYQGAGLLQSQTIPLVIGDTMYVSTPYSRVVALDAATGAEKWAFTIPDGDRPSLRGVAYWPGDGEHAPTIIFGTRMGRLYSIDAASGQPKAEFGDNGMLNLKTPDVMHTGIDKSFIVPSPPIIYRNLIITGAGPGEGPGGTRGGDGPAGDTRAFDARTGALVWTFHSVPRPGELGHDAWEGESWRNRSGVNVWGLMTVDAERGIVYMPFGGPNNDRYGGDRPGDNLFGSSIVAVDANTGRYLWHFQVVHHDIWDYDTQAPPTLVDITHNGETIPAVAIVNKTGLLFFLNRVTGAPIYPIEERPVPRSNVPTERPAATQPFPVVTEPLSRNTISRAELYQDTPEHKAWCEKLVDDNDMYLSPEPYTPIRLNQYTVTYPGTQGGVNWGGGAFDPTNGLFVVNVNNMGQPMRLVLTEDGQSYINSGPLAGTQRFWNRENRMHCAATPWGQLVAVDVNTGRVAWRSTLGVTDTAPEGFQDTGRPSLGGPSLTASGLTFMAGTDDNRFRAFETRTGRELWEVRLPATAHSTPVIYSDANGRQYVAITATGGGLLAAPVESDSLIVYTLP